MPTRYLSAAIALAWFVRVDICVAADESLARHNQARCEFLIRGMLHARQQIRSGMVEIQGVKRAWDKGNRLLAGQVTATYCFDSLKDSYRYEQTEPCNVVIAAPGKHVLPSAGMAGAQFPVKYKCCRTGEYFADWSQIGPTTYSSLILRPVHYDSRAETPNCGRRPIDPLAAGVMRYFDFLQGKTAIDVYESLLQRTVESLESKGSTVTIELRDNVAVHTLVIDEDRLAPLAITSRSHDDPSVFTSRAEWKTVDDLLVPTSLTVRLVLPDVAEDQNEYQFLWTRINDEFSPAEFEYTAFTGMPSGIIEAFDARGKEVDHLGVWVADGRVEKRVVQPPAGTVPIAATGSGKWLRVLIGVNVLVIGIVLAIYFARSRWQSRSR